MIQNQIVEYINSQLKLGVSRDTIKTTLTGAGWVAADVEDTLKSIEPQKASPQMQPQPQVQPVAAAKPAVFTASAVSTARPAMSPATNPAPQTIKVSDLVSASPSTFTPAASPAMKSSLTGPAPASKTSVSANTYQAPASTMSKPHGSRGALITDIVLVIIILAVGGFAGFLYMQNNSLNAQLGSLNGQSSGVNSQLSTLQAQVAASTTALTAQVSTLTGEMQELQTELSFYVAPAGTPVGATSTVTVSGTVSGGGKLPYVITATYGVKIFVANSKVAVVIAALSPLVGTAGSTTSSTSTAPTAPTTAQFSGTYIPGSDSITLTAVNGTAL